MDTTLLFAFLATTLVFVITPGPSVAFVTAQALRRGTRAAYLTVAGDALGAVLQITIAASSLSVLISLSDIVLPPLQIAGGLFVLYMAYQAFAAGARTDANGILSTDRASFWAGFFACISNPKAIMFFVALFPAFISAEHNVLVQTMVYGVIFLTLDAIAMLAYALLAMRAVRKAKAQWINTNVLSGLGLAGVGLAMIVKGYRSLPQA